MSTNDQPDGICAESVDDYRIPSPTAAAERVEAFVRWFGDGEVGIDVGKPAEDDPPLYARDLNALTCAVQHGYRADGPSRCLHDAVSTNDPTPPSHDPCCSSHGVAMDCDRYRRTHFVEVRPCCGADADRLRAEGIDPAGPWQERIAPHRIAEKSAPTTDPTPAVDVDALLATEADRARARLDALPASSRPAWYRARVNGDDAWWESLVQAECEVGHVVYMDDGDGTVYACPACALAAARAEVERRTSQAVSLGDQAVEMRLQRDAARAEAERLTAILHETPPTETVHACPPEGSGVMPCCGRTPLEVQSDRMTVYPRLVTCAPTPGPTLDSGQGEGRVEEPEGDGSWWGSADCFERECEDFGDPDAGMGLDESAWPCSHVVWVPARIEEWIRESERAATPATTPDLREAIERLGNGTTRAMGRSQYRVSVDPRMLHRVLAALAAAPSETEAGR